MTEIQAGLPSHRRPIAFDATGDHNHTVKPTRPSLVVVFLVAGLLVALPGVAEAVEATSAGRDCSEPCPGDTPDGKCPSSCDECTCCPRAMTSVVVSFAGPVAPRRVETLLFAIPSSVPFELAQGVFHPPRA